MMYKPKYYRRDGTPYTGKEDFLQWAADYEDINKRIVKVTKLKNGIRVSTIWLGLDHSFDPSSPPVIFETMVFSAKVKTTIMFGKKRKYHEDLDSMRYTTEAEALRGHQAFVRKFNKVKAIRKAKGHGTKKT